MSLSSVFWLCHPKLPSQQQNDRDPRLMRKRVNLDENDEFAQIFRLWSGLLSAAIGGLIGVCQYFVGANLLVVVSSAALGIAASEFSFRLRGDDTWRRALGPIAFFCCALAFTAGAIFLCHRLGLEIATGAVVLVMAILIFGEFIGGRAAATGVIIAAVSSTLYWLIPPANSFTIADGFGLAQFIVVLFACLSTFAMLQIVRRLNS